MLRRSRELVLRRVQGSVHRRVQELVHRRDPALLSFVLLALAGALGALILSGCATREETPRTTADSTLVRPAKSPGDIDATITFASRIGKKTGKRYGVGQAFDMEDDARIYGLVDLENLAGRGDRPLLFHLVWLKPSGKTLFKKMIEMAPGEADSVLESSISIPPGKRPAGIYRFQVYLFRELIAEKSLELRGLGGDEEAEDDREL